MRFAFVALGLASVSSAFASFDLVLVSDATKNCIHRYDGDSGAYLGSFGAGRMTGPRGMALDQVNSTVVVTANAGLSAFNYNTGELLWINPNFSSVLDICLTSTGGLLKTGTGTTPFTLVSAPQTSNSQTLYTGPTSTSWTGVAVDSANKLFALDAQNGRIHRWTNGVTAAPELSTVAGSHSATSGLSSRGTTLLALTPLGRMVSFDSGTLNDSEGGTPAGAAWTDSIDTAFGHSNLAWGLGTTAGGTVLETYAKSVTVSNLTYSPTGQVSLSQVTTPTSMVVVLAPEPGSFAALAFGAFGLVRSRKRNSTNKSK